MTNPKYNVIFRTCDAVQAIRGSRPFNLDKPTVIKACFLGLVEALHGFPYTIHVLGDKLSDGMLGFFQSFTEKDPAITLSNGVYGNDESIRQSIARALSCSDDEWVYLCEDDYLHQPHAFLWIDELIRTRNETLRFEPGRRWMRSLFKDVQRRPLFIHPADYPDRYRPGRRQFALIFLTKYNHWRQISNTTFTFMAEAKTLRQFEKDLRAAAVGANDDLLSRRLFAHVLFRGRGLCVSPIPGVATHMTEGVMTPLVDWESRARQLIARLETR